MATNLVCRGGNIFIKCITSFKQILCKSLALFKQLICVIENLGFWSQYFIYIAVFLLQPYCFCFVSLVFRFCAFVLFLCYIYNWNLCL
jgi:hypothetical protein